MDSIGPGQSDQGLHDRLTESLDNVNISMYSKLPLLRPPLVLPKSGLISGMVLILNVEPSSR